MATRAASSTPYIRIADDLRKRIASGEYPVGGPLPSGKVLAEEYKAARNTVASAIRVLREEGLVASEQGRGSYVLARPEEDRDEQGLEGVVKRLGELQGQVEQLSKRVAELEAR
ncbi:GntR family transcriptional regulator [Nocardiopsis sp. RSe5-2]|uniref:GntR family transcriptional regulator n=1 Tax=Nocardiopsis endophytica TaxID=3018445 RepID=A0ABT4U074_9ACTN|nr:GntR family transcriptional regulator [Nocardiopsis endophytica]MDA2810347.1 GntR family transcriptional regulator [Nocardiopsis endophytica]